MICKYCGAESPDTAKFCCECGRGFYGGSVSPDIEAASVPEVRTAEDGSPVYTNFGGAVVLFFQNYTNFSGRSTRSEYWYACLYVVIVSLILYCLKWGGISLPYYLWMLGSFIPQMSLTFRRLHDTGRTCMTYILLLIPSALMELSYYSANKMGSRGAMMFCLSFAAIYFLLLIVNLVLFCQPSQPEANKYGRAPHDGMTMT